MMGVDGYLWCFKHGGDRRVSWNWWVFYRSIVLNRDLFQGEVPVFVHGIDFGIMF